MRQQVLSPSWLGPATDAVRALATGHDADAALATALERDERRTALFLSLALAELGEGVRVRASWLSTAFGDLAVHLPVSRGQRAIWIAAARGAYGPAGSAFVAQRLTTALDRAVQDPEPCEADGPSDPVSVLRLLTSGNTTAVDGPAGQVMTLIREDLREPDAGLARLGRQAITPNIRITERTPASSPSPLPGPKPMPQPPTPVKARRRRRSWTPAPIPILISIAAVVVLVTGLFVLLSMS